MIPLRLLPVLLALSATAASLRAQDTVRSVPTRESKPPLKLGGYLQVRETYEEDVGLTAAINRARVAATGEVLAAVTWRLQAEFRTGSAGTGRASVSLVDAYLRYEPGPWAIQAGQFKTPFAREFLVSVAEIETADRSVVVDSLAPRRDIGIMGEYKLGGRATLSAGVFNGEGQNVTANRDSSLLGVARAVARPVPQVALGLDLGRYFGDSTRFGVDASYEGERLTLRAEYLGQTRGRGAGPDDWGWYALGAYGPGRVLQLVGRYEEFGRPSVAAEQRTRAWTAAVNLFPRGRDLRLTLDYTSRRSGRPGERRGRALVQGQVRF